MQDIEGLGTLIAGNNALFRRPFVKRFAICYRTTVLSVWPVCNVHVRYYGQMVEWIKIKLDTELGLGPGHIVLDGDPASPQKRHSPPIFSSCMLWPNGWMDQDATWYGGRPRPRRHGFTWGLSSSPPSPKGRAQQPTPNFRHTYWVQTAGWIKMPLGIEVGLGPGHIVLDGDLKGAQPLQFSAHVYYGQTAGWIKMPLGTEVDLGPGHIMLDGDPAPPKRGTAAPLFSARVYCGQTVAHFSYC